MKTLDKILDILSTMATQTGSDAPDLKTVMYASPWDANVRLDRKPTPAAITYLLKGFEVDTSTGMRHDKVDVEVFFCTRCDLATKGEETKSKMETVEPIVDEFISLVYAEKSFKVDGNIVANTAYGKFDTNVCGYSVNFTIVDRVPSCI